MKFYQFGNKISPVIFLFPGTCCHWKVNFEKHIPLLQEKFNVIVVSYDGFDETENTIFSDMISETEKIEIYIKEQFKGKIYAAYGCSLGGSFVSLLVGRKNIHIEHAIIGSSDMDQNGKFIAKIETSIVVKLLYSLIKEGKIPKIFQKRIDNAPPEKKEYYNNIINVFTHNGEGLSFIKKESIRNQFYSDLVTPVGKKIDVKGTTIHVFYATRMGKEYEKRYMKHFAKPDICRHDYEHEQLFFQYPEKWYQEILRVCEMK